MKELMWTINFVLFLGSVLGVGWHMICGQFGIAWMAAACATFSYCNVRAMD